MDSQEGVAGKCIHCGRYFCSYKGENFRVLIFIFVPPSFKFLVLTTFVLLYLLKLNWFFSWFLIRNQFYNLF